jgi:ELWxxDGT repeat protein
MSSVLRRFAGVGLSVALAALVFFSLRATAFELVADLNDGAPARVLYSSYMRGDIPGGTLLAMEDETHGSELWFTDNTPQGTRLVKDIFPGRHASGPGSYTRLGNVSVFLASDGVHGVELWRSDGTSAGTYMLADIGPGAQNYGGGYPSAVLNGVLYFSADDGVVGNELWRTDGTTSGTCSSAVLDRSGYPTARPLERAA